MAEPFIGEIRIFSFNSAPTGDGWAQCNGQLLPINQNQALFSLLGTTFILEDYAGGPTDDAAVQSFLSTTNNAATTSADHGGAGFTSIADCPNPP